MAALLHLQNLKSICQLEDSNHMNYDIEVMVYIKDCSVVFYEFIIIIIFNKKRVLYLSFSFKKQELVTQLCLEKEQ